MFNDSPRKFQLVGHRGWPEKYPENSLPGIRATLEFGVDGVELDIQLSADGVPVLMHDEGLMRVCGQDLNVGELGYDELKEISCHESQRFGNEHFSCPIVSLEELCQSLNSYEATFYIEIKHESFERFSREYILNAVLDASSSLDKAQRVIISFDYDVVKLARDLHDETIGWVIKYYDEESHQKARSLEPDYLICNYTKFPKEEGEAENSFAKLWAGSWQWFIYDLVDKSMVDQLVDLDVKVIETWDIESLV